MYPNTFYRVSVKALIRDKNNHLLLVKENQDTWDLPGGGLDHGEDDIIGLRRELHEELGIDSPDIGDIVHIKTFYLDSKQAWLLWIVYDVKIHTDDFIYGEGVTTAKFINPATLSHSDNLFEKTIHEIMIHG